MKKHLGFMFMLLFLLSLLLLSVQADADGQDTEPPRLGGYGWEKWTVSISGRVRYQAFVTDDGSGVEAVNMVLVPTDGNIRLLVPLTLSGDNNWYNGTFNIAQRVGSGETIPLGKYTIGIEAYDKAGNYAQFETNATLTIKDDLLSAFLRTTKWDDVRAKSNMNQLAEATGGNGSPYTFSYSITDNQGKVVDSGTPTGGANQIGYADRFWNFYAPSTAGTYRMSVTVSDGLTSVTTNTEWFNVLPQLSPSIESYTITPTSIEAPDTVNITIAVSDVQDDVSKIRGWMSSSGIGVDYTCQYNPVTELWEGTIDFSQYVPEGNWSLYIEAHDAQNNSSSESYQNVLWVTNPQSDTEPPTLNLLALDKTTITTSESVRFYAKVTDNLSGVESVMFYVDTYKYGFGVPMTYNASTDLWEGIFAVSEKLTSPYVEKIELGECKITGVLKDKIGNSVNPEISQTLTIVSSPLVIDPLPTIDDAPVGTEKEIITTAKGGNGGGYVFNYFLVDEKQNVVLSSGDARYRWAFLAPSEGGTYQVVASVSDGENVSARVQSNWFTLTQSSSSWLDESSIDAFINGIPAFSHGRVVHFFTSGAGMNYPRYQGIKRWRPVSWHTNPSGNWDNPPYEGSFSTEEMSPGNHTLTITLFEEEYDEHTFSWKLTGRTQQQEFPYIILGSPPQTGDTTPLLLYVFLIIVCCLGFFGLFIAKGSNR